MGLKWQHLSESICQRLACDHISYLRHDLVYDWWTRRLKFLLLEGVLVKWSCWLGSWQDKPWREPLSTVNIITCKRQQSLLIYGLLESYVPITLTQY
ncbi:putative membrane protein C6F6.04c [Fusarium oxysporum f. sp. albedinis]|nr:putative membrane protein C6F6.04c [Fusarium oxysporum f. sp. albedinis]